MNIQARVALDKEAHPEDFCPDRRCLWRTGGGSCPKHRQPEVSRLPIQNVDALIDSILDRP